MTKEQYKQRRDELEAQIKELEQQYIDACPYKVGDKVLVKYGKKEKEAFLNHIGIRNWGDYYDFNFVAVKKDGTPSLQGAGVYSTNLSDIIKKL